MIAMCSYRSWENFESRFARKTQDWDGQFAVSPT
jgi:homoserine O-acetyltransferase/O-succinyltransferase